MSELISASHTMSELMSASHTMSELPRDRKTILKIKRVTILGRSIPIIIKNRSFRYTFIVVLCNVLLVRRELEESDFPPGAFQMGISVVHLLNLLVKKLLQLNDIKNPSEALGLLNSNFRLSVLDPRCHRIESFEPNPLLKICRLFHVAVYHGWIINHQETSLSNMIGSTSLEALLKNYEWLLEDASSEEGEVLRDFVRRGNVDQLTPFGLSLLKNGLEEGECCILYYMDQLNTLYKFNGELYLLVRDESVADYKENVVWEIIHQVPEKREFMNGDFEPVYTKDTVVKCFCQR